jgi:DNA-binding MarR family transcriptional regulator
MRKTKVTVRSQVFSEQVIALAQADLHDLNLPQVAVLALRLRPATHQTIRGMASVLRSQKPSVTRAVDRLEFAGYVMRLKNPAEA